MLQPEWHYKQAGKFWIRLVPEDMQKVEDAFCDFLQFGVEAHEPVFTCFGAGLPCRIDW